MSLTGVQRLVVTVSAAISAVGIPVLIGLIWRLHKKQVETLKLFTFKEFERREAAFHETMKIKLSLSVLFLLLLAPVSQLHGQGKPVHVETVLPKLEPDVKDKEDTYGVLHGHMLESHSDDEKVWLYAKYDMDRWNALCDRLIHSTGALGRIVHLDLAAGAEAPYRFATCKQKSIFSRIHADVSSIIALDRMRENGDESGLEAVERLLNAKHRLNGTYKGATGALSYLAYRTSKRCMPEDLLIRLWSSPWNSTTYTQEGEDYRAFIALLHGIASYNYRYSSMASDDAGLKFTLLKLRREASNQNDATLRKLRLLALNHGEATLRACFKR